MKITLIIISVVMLAGIGGYALFQNSRTVPEAADQTLDVLTGIEAIEKKRDVADPELAVIRAKAIFRKLQLEDVDFSSGPMPPIIPTRKLAGLKTLAEVSPKVGMNLPRGALGVLHARYVARLANDGCPLRASCP